MDRSLSCYFNGNKRFLVSQGIFLVLDFSNFQSLIVVTSQIGDEIGADEMVRRLKTLAHTFQATS